MQGKDLFVAFESVLCIMANNGLKVQDLFLLRPYNEYKRLIDEGNKKMYVEAVMNDKFKMGRTSVLSMVAKMEREIKM